MTLFLGLFPLAWAPDERGVYAEDVTVAYKASALTTKESSRVGS